MQLKTSNPSVSVIHSVSYTHLDVYKRQVYDLLAKENHKVYTLGPIIHNEQVVEDLASQGVQVIEHPDEIAKEDRSQAILVIRSHGVPESVIHTLKELSLIHIFTKWRICFRHRMMLF